MKLKQGQKVWFIDHIQNEVKPGVLISTENQSSFGDHPTLIVEHYKYSFYTKERILEDWIFADKNEAIKKLMSKIEQDIERKKQEIEGMKSKLYNVRR